MKQERLKKRKKSEREKGTAASANQNVAPPTHEEPKENDRMDFGGLPNRDLKKNLGGCG